MMTIQKVERTRILPDKKLYLVELRGLSSDEKTTIIDDGEIDNGSTLIEINTGKIYIYDYENSEWDEV